MITAEPIETDTAATCAKCRCHRAIAGIVRTTVTADHRGVDAEVAGFICAGCASDLARDLQALIRRSVMDRDHIAAPPAAAKGKAGKKGAAKR